MVAEGNTLAKVGIEVKTGPSLKSSFVVLKAQGKPRNLPRLCFKRC